MTKTDSHTKADMNASLTEADKQAYGLDADSFRKRMADRLHKVWCLQHGEDFEGDLELPGFQRGSYVRS